MQRKQAKDRLIAVTIWGSSFRFRECVLQIDNAIVPRCDAPALIQRVAFFMPVLNFVIGGLSTCSRSSSHRSVLRSAYDSPATNYLRGG